MAYKSGAGYALTIDIDPGGTPTQTAIEVTNVDEALNEVMDTFFRLSDEGFAQNIVTGLDPEYSLTVKAEDADLAIAYIAGLRFTTDRSTSMVITDNLLAADVTITVDVEITSISNSRSIDGVTEISITIKFRGKPVIS